MRDTPERKRPNAKYPLTEKKISRDEGPSFYYSREQRLAKAPPNVRALYEESPKKKFGFFRTLTATRPLAMLFFSIMILCAAIIIISIFNLAGDHGLGGNRLALEAVKFQGETIVVLTKTVKDSERAYTGPVDIGISPAAPKGSDAKDYPVFTNRIFFSLNAEEAYRFSLPFEAEKLLVLLQGELDSASFTITVK
jgi:hypothetical protein